ncbi:MAG: fibronectin type III domain-containing protein [Steroidobacteraceae bacterium]
MLMIRPPKASICLSALLSAGLLLSGCGNGVGVSTPASATATVAAVSSPPVALAGTPASSVTVGQNYAFQPTVSAGNGTVTFQIQGKPTWAAFNTATGALIGTPAVANEGKTGAITITGSNGSNSASIGPFTIAVNAAPAAPATGSASLSWTVPTQNTDGSPVTDLAGYHIYFGTTAGAWTSTISVLDAAETSYVVAGLARGTYYFSIVAFNTAGEDSPQSNIGSKTI